MCFDLQSFIDSPVSNFLFSDDEAIPSNERDANNFKDRRCCLRDYQGDILESVYDWNFQIFDLAEKTDNVLSQVKKLCLLSVMLSSSSFLQATLHQAAARL